MARVPLAQGPQVERTALQGGYRNPVDTTAGLRQAAQIASTVADGLERRALRDAETEAWGKQSQMLQDFSAWRAEALGKSKGVNAKGYADQVREWWTKAGDTYTADASPLAKQALQRSIQSFTASNYASATEHEQQQLEIANVAAFKGNVSALEGQAIAGGPKMAPAIISSIDKAIRAEGAKRGIEVEQEVLASSTRVHANIIAGMMQRDPNAAQQYFNDNKKQIDPARWDEITKGLEATLAVNDGSRAADAIWSKVGPKGLNEPVMLNEMEAAAREQFPNDPTRQKAAIAELRERVAAHDKSQTEANAASVNKVYELIDAGLPMARVKMTPAWRALPGKERDSIEYQQELRANSREQRANAQEGREYTRLLREQQMLLLRNYEDYARMQDPELLAKMSRDQVIAMRALFGNEGTQHLLNRWDALQKPGAVGEARIDEDQFVHYANQMGVDVKGAKSPTQKTAVIELRNRVETVLAAEEAEKKRRLTRVEKDEVMKREIAAQVTVQPEPFLGVRIGFDRKIPIINLKPEELARVVVPQPDIQRIRAKMAERYAKVQDPRFADTPDNVRYWYMMEKSSKSTPAVGNGQPR